MKKKPRIDRTWYRRPKELRQTRLTAGGVVLRRFGRQWKVALAREGDFHDWVLPKGGVDEGESLVQAAHREIAEEAGVDHLQALGKLGVRSRLNFRKSRWIQVHYYLFVATGSLGQPTDIRKHPHRARWFALTQLPDMLWPEQRELLQSKRRLIRTLLQRVQRKRPRPRNHPACRP